MKYLNKLNLVALLLAVAIVSCDPLEDTFAELDANTDTAISADMVLTLEDDDYELLEDAPGGAGAAQYKNFDSPDEPRTLIPVILNSRFPHLGNGSSALVTYDYYSPIRINNAISHTVTAQEYQDMGQTFGNFNDDGDITSAANYLYPDAEEEDLLTLTYQYYTGSSVETRTSKVARLNGFWYISYEPTQDDYRFMGQSFNNFDSRTTGRNRVGVLLTNKYPFADEGDVRTAVFTYTYVPSGGSRRFEDFLVAYEFDGSAWVGVEDVTAQSLQFGNEDGTWVPDNTIKYVLSGADYTTIATQYAGTPYGDNLNTYGNFNRTGSGTSWSAETMVEALGFLLNSGGFVTTDGQKYVITVVVYNGATVTEDWSLIRENGVWVLND